MRSNTLIAFLAAFASLVIALVWLFHGTADLHRPPQVDQSLSKQAMAGQQVGAELAPEEQEQTPRRADSERSMLGSPPLEPAAPTVFDKGLIHIDKAIEQAYSSIEAKKDSLSTESILQDPRYKDQRALLNKDDIAELSVLMNQHASDIAEAETMYSVVDLDSARRAIVNGDYEIVQLGSGAKIGSRIHTISQSLKEAGVQENNIHVVPGSDVNSARIIIKTRDKYPDVFEAWDVMNATKERMRREVDAFFASKRQGR